MEEKPIPWEDMRCGYKDEAGRCSGIRLGNDGNCFAHTTSDQRELALASFGAGADLNFTRGVPLTEKLLQEILDHAPLEHGRRVLTKADFTLATFTGDAVLDGATFIGSANLQRVIFTGHARFQGANFHSNAGFDSAIFRGDALFDNAAFRDVAWFANTDFSENAWFRRVDFSGMTTFDSSAFRGNVHFEYATFSDSAHFDSAAFFRSACFTNASFSGNTTFESAQLSHGAHFDSTVFLGDAWFTNASFSTPAFRGSADFDQSMFAKGTGFSWVTFFGPALFRSAIFERARRFGPVLALDTCVFDEVTFSTDIDIEAAAKSVSCVKTKFRDEVNFRLRWADVTFEDADFASACLLDRAVDAFKGLDETGLAVDREPSGRPRVLSVQRANVANLVLADVDLRACRFKGAHELDGLRIESKRQFAERPQGWRWNAGWPPVWKWTVRRAIAEEHEWRYRYEGGMRQKGWYPQACGPPEAERLPSRGDKRADAAVIQNIYRDLRKSREDRKDEPGAADFYYGEMEMRRAAADRFSFERLLLSLYWLAAGYGLRASRAFAALAITVVAGALFLNVWGFDPDESLGRALLFSLESTTSLFRVSSRFDDVVTFRGEVVQVVIRVLGPLFFALALLSLRARVKR